MSRNPVTPVSGRGGPLAWMAKNSVAANLLMAVLLVGGMMTLSRIRQEVFPEFELDLIMVNVPYPGASPSEVEQGVLLAIEEAVRAFDEIKEVRATATEGFGVVAIELEYGVQPDRVLADVKSAIDRITSFPQDIERPVVSLATNRTEVITVAVYGDQDERTLRRMAENIRDDLLNDPRITMVELGGVRPYEISVEVPQENLRRYGLTLEAIANRIRQASVELPAGGVKTAKGEVLLRTTERRLDGAGFGDIVLLSTPDGSQLKVADVGEVIDGFQDNDTETFFNGRRAALLHVFRVGDQTPIDVTDAVHEYVANRKQELPDTIGIAALADRSEMYQDRVDLLRRNAILGLTLVLLVLGLFLELRLAFWVTLGIPISFIGALLLMPAADASINMISLFAFIVTLGIVVDDAIVVGEAIFERRQQGMKFLDAAIAGVHDVAGPVTFSVLTTIIAFTPLLFIPGTTGKFFGVIPVVVILVLFLSLVESLLILPAHLAHSKPASGTGRLARAARAQQRFTEALDRVAHHGFRPFLRLAVGHRYVTLAAGVALLIAVLGVVAGGRMNFTFMPRIDSDRVVANLRMPFGTSIEDTREVQHRLVTAAHDLLEEIGGTDRMSRGLLSRIGAASGARGSTLTDGSGSSHIGEVTVYLVPSDDRPIPASEFARRWRTKVGELTGIDTLTFQFSTGVSATAPIDIELSHPDTEVLETAASRLAGAYGEFDGVRDIDAGFTPGKEQLDLRLRPEARSMGITELEMARQLRGSFFGVEAVRQQRGRDEVRTMVRLPQRERNSEFNVEELLLRSPEGKEILLTEAADVRRGRSFTEIKRVDGQRVVNVTADVVDGVANANKVVADVVAEVIPGLQADYPGLRFAPGGQQRSQQETFGALGSSYLMALIAMFALLAVAFGSYFQPLIIMAAIPFGVVGALGGHLLLGYDLSVMSLMGMVALSGVVVNDSLVLIDAINRYRANGMGVFEAVVAGGTRRLRPILLTSLTTFFGLMPMILETSVQARFLIPMAISLGFGVLFATVVILLLVPALYLVLEDAGRALRRFWAFLLGREPEEEEPAGVPERAREAS